MNSPILQLLVLAGIAIFLILRLKSVLGTREGFEKPPVVRPDPEAKSARSRDNFEVIEGGPDHDIVDHVPEGSPQAEALSQMKRAEPSFNVSEFLQGARGAYEMILMGFEKGELDEIRGFLDDDVHEAFASVVHAREEQGLKIDAEFIGVREMALQDATFDSATGEGEITIRFVGELIQAVRDAEGTVIEGHPTTPRKQRDVWTFARRMGADDPNWTLVATGG